jgi:uncharacterized protein
MSHQFFEGEVYHKRYLPKIHEFTYKFFMLDLDLSQMSKSNNKMFSFEKFNLFSFKAKDHFGTSTNFLENIDDLLKKFNLSSSEKMRFITLPRTVGFVFNPISLLVLIDDGKPTYMLAEVHNYNGGRVVYPVKLTEKDGRFIGNIEKYMYVSPFFGRLGSYEFLLGYENDELSCSVDLYEEGSHKLRAAFKGSALSFTTKNSWRLFARHTLLTVWVVTRTLWQTIRLWVKGLKWHSPTLEDQKRRF